MRPKYTTKLSELESKLDGVDSPKNEHGFIIREFLAKEALPLTKRRKKTLITPELLDIIKPRLAQANYPSGSTPINDSYTLTLIITRHDKDKTQIIKKEEVVITNQYDSQ